jgi:hypothetical protein
VREGVDDGPTKLETPLLEDGSGSLFLILLRWRHNFMRVEKVELKSGLK